MDEWMLQAYLAHQTSLNPILYAVLILVESSGKGGRINAAGVFEIGPDFACTQYWQTSGPKLVPTRYPAYRSIHWAGIELGMLSPDPNRTQLGRAEMEAKPDLGEAFEGQSGNCGWAGDPM